MRCRNKCIKRELNIIVNKEDNAIKRGDFFEEIVSNIFKTQRYTIKKKELILLEWR